MESLSKEDAEQAVKFAEEKFGVTFHDEQRTAITSFLTGSDIFVGLPTGFGKSLIFQAIPICYDFIICKQKGEASSGRSDPAPTQNAIGIVVSPLVSLCKNQVESLSNFGIKAAYLGDLDDAGWKDVEDGHFSLIYASPEMLLDDKCSSILMGDVYTNRLCGIFVDEVHCIAKW